MAVGIKPGDILFGHSNIGFFGFPEEGRNPQLVADVILEAIFDVIGSGGTLVVPTFSYSFGKKEIFDLEFTPGIGGPFAEAVRIRPGAVRSLDPSASVAALGARALELCSNAPENSHGPDSFFDRIWKANGKVCNFNFNATTTFTHFTERVLQVPYRFDKTFEGVVRAQGREEKRKSTIFVRKELIPETEFAYERFDRLAVESGLCLKAKVGRGFIKCMAVRDQFDLIERNIGQDPNFLTRAGNPQFETHSTHRLGV